MEPLKMEMPSAYLQVLNRIKADDLINEKARGGCL